MKLTSIALAVAAAVATVAGDHDATPAAVTGGDILNYALNVECLMAEFYSFAAYGQGLSADLRGGGPAPIGGRKAALTGIYAQIAKEHADDHIGHVAALRIAMGQSGLEAVPCPQIDIGPAWVKVAEGAAGGKLPEGVDPLDPYTDDVFFLHGAFFLEDVIVTMYAGGIEGLATLTPPYITQRAAQFLAVEGAHAAVIRSALINLNLAGVETPYAPIPVTIQSLSNLRDSLDGDVETDGGIVRDDGVTPFWTGTTIEGGALTRTIPEISNIFLLGNASKGGFFPKGVNGYFGPNAAPKTPVAPAPKKPDAPTTGGGACAARYAQCGGEGFAGPTCCKGNSVCVVKNKYYSGCRPGPAVEGTIPFYKACSLDAGAVPCEEGSTCTQKRPNFAGCMPDN